MYSHLFLGNHHFLTGDIIFLIQFLKSSGEHIATKYYHPSQELWALYLTETYKEGTYVVLHIWGGYLCTTAYIRVHQDEQTHLLVSHKIQHKGIWQAHAVKNLELTEWKLDYIYRETQNTGCRLQTSAMT